MQLQHACDKLEDESKIAILKKYNYTAKCYTIALASKILLNIYIYIYIYIYLIATLLLYTIYLLYY